jgi:hypothetical protein
MVAVLPQGVYAPVVIQEMKREVESIMKHSGLTIGWHMGEGHDVYHEPLAVVKLTGTCRMDSREGSPGNAGPLGWTHSANGILLPFSELACDNIRRAITSEMHAEVWPRGNALLGRAMGRVLAHELFHIVASTKDHTGSGISKSAFTPSELLSGRLELDPASLEMIQEGFHPGR